MVFLGIPYVNNIFKGSNFLAQLALKVVFPALSLNLIFVLLFRGNLLTEVKVVFCVCECSSVAKSLFSGPFYVVS